MRTAARQHAIAAEAARAAEDGAKSEASKLYLLLKGGDLSAEDRARIQARLNEIVADLKRGRAGRGPAK